MYDPKKSDTGIVAMKPTNDADRSVTEPVEQRPVTNGNRQSQSTDRTQSRVPVSQAAERIRQFVPICRQPPKVGAVCVNAHVRICAGGAGQPASLPRKRAPERPAASNSAPKPQRQPTGPATSAPRSRAIPSATKRKVWQRDGGRCRYVDPVSRRRCNSQHLLQIDHIKPVSLGGTADPDNLRLLCFAHHHHRHADSAHRRALPANR